LHKLFNDMAGPHLGDQKICPKIGNKAIYHDYFAPSPMFGEVLFKCKYRMIRNLFLRIMASIYEYDVFFVQCPDCTRKLRLSSIQKCITALEQLT
jgi:hypothetical protein